MTELNMAQALNHALRAELARDQSVVMLGEDVGTLGGVFRVTQGLAAEFGTHRVITTPLSENGIVGTAIGMAMNGLRPVTEIQFADFVYPAFDQLVNEAAKMRYRSGGDHTVPMVVRAPVGGGIRGGHYHSQSPESLFIHSAGLKVVCPSNPYDAKGLLIAAIRDPDPVIFFEPKRVYRAVKVEVPEEDYVVPLGKARVVRAGKHVTLLTWGSMLFESLAAARSAAASGVECEVIDLRTLWPFDIETILESIERTGRLVVVHEAPRACGFGAELVSSVVERAFARLRTAPVRVTGLDTPFPYTLENEYLPLAHRIFPALMRSASC
jgi:pyruvate dehydrogenase E1 component beta subunit